MTLKLIAEIENHGDAGYVGWIESIKGLVVQGATLNDVCKELITSLKVKLAHDLGIPATELQEVTEEEMEQIRRQNVLREKKDKYSSEINLTLTSTPTTELQEQE